MIPRHRIARHDTPAHHGLLLLPFAPHSKVKPVLSWPPSKSPSRSALGSRMQRWGPRWGGASCTRPLQRGSRRWTGCWRWRRSTRSAWQVRVVVGRPALMQTLHPSPLTPLVSPRPYSAHDGRPPACPGLGGRHRTASSNEHLSGECGHGPRLPPPVAEGALSPRRRGHAGVRRPVAPRR